MSAPSQRYTAVAIVLHWAIAAAILFNIPLGFWMHEQAEEGLASEGVFAAFQLHKSIGLAVLGLSLARLMWRLANPPPALPAHMPAWERFAAKATHWAFYALMIGLPLSGWVFVSAGWSLHEDASLAVPTRFFGLIDVPALFGLPDASEDLRAVVAAISFQAHALMAWTAVGLAALHVLAALKHHVFDKDEVLAHMIPGLRAPFQTDSPPKNPVRLAILGGGLGLTAVALVAALFAVSGELAPQPPHEASTFEVVEAEAPPSAVTPESAPAGPGAPPAWRVNAGSSAIGFAYTYADESGESRFEGRFTRWRADIRFDSDNLAASRAAVTIETASASTGMSAHDAALPTSGWFNSGAFPNARFVTREIRRSGAGYVAVGDLTIRDRTRRIELPFSLTITGDRAVMEGQVNLDRRDFDVGDNADGDDMISRDITLSIRVQATRAP